MAGSASDMMLQLTHGRVERVKLKRAWPRFLDGGEFGERNNTGGPRHVPGIHVAVNFERLPSLQFSHGFGLWKQHRLSNAEIDMIRLMNDITDEPSWHTDINDLGIVTGWKDLALSNYISDSSLWDWCLFELIRKAKGVSTRSSLFAIDSASRVIKTDRPKDCELFQQLTQTTRDRSISPWLYPFIFAQSPIRVDDKTVNLENVKRCIGGGVLPPRPFWDTSCWAGEKQYYSKKFQWLASDVRFTGIGNNVCFTSPINNLHPHRHRPLYGAIERLISESIEEWEQVLMYRTLQRNGPRIKPQPEKCRACTASTAGNCSCTIELNNFSEWSRGYLSPGTEDPPEGRKWKPARAIHGKYNNSARLYNSIALAKGFADRGLQVYVELANLFLDPKGAVPKEHERRFEWNLNGNRNERIVATTIMCLHRTNIKPESGHISFRAETKRGNWEDAAAQDKSAEKSPEEKKAAPEEPNEDAQMPSFQDLVMVQFPVGRAITFPNILQHKFEPLQLSDSSMEGCLQFLAVHLVDPHYVVCSTHHVPPQSVSWWWEAADLDIVCAHHRIPPELRREITDFAIGFGCGGLLEDGDERRNARDRGRSGPGSGGPGNGGGTGNTGPSIAGPSNVGPSNTGSSNVRPNTAGPSNAGPSGGGSGGSGGNGNGNEEYRYARDNSPERPQEERPIQIEAGVRIRLNALDEHSRVMDAVNGWRMYGVPSHLRQLFRDGTDSTVPLDHSELVESGRPMLDVLEGVEVGEEEEEEEEDLSQYLTGRPQQNPQQQNSQQQNVPQQNVPQPQQAGQIQNAITQNGQHPIGQHHTGQPQTVQQTNGQPSGQQQLSNGQSSNGQSSNGQPSNGQQQNGQP